jgi:hypothetical protein
LNGKEGESAKTSWLVRLHITNGAIKPGEEGIIIEFNVTCLSISGV